MEKYLNGSDMLLYVGTSAENAKAVGHCTTHTMTCTSETKDRAVKPLASAPVSAGLWKNKGVVGLSISLSADGLVYQAETESGYPTLFDAWKAGASVYAKCMERAEDSSPYLVGKFIITSLERTDPAQDDSTYKVSLENDGMPTTMDASVFTSTGE